MSNPTALTGASYTIKINGVDLHEYGILGYVVPNLGMGPVDLRSASLPGRHSSYGFSGVLRPRPFTVTGEMLGNSVSDLRTRLDLLKPNALGLAGKYSDELAPIRVEFADQTDRYYPCLYTGEFQVAALEQFPTASYHVQFSLPLLQLTPWALSTAITVAAPSGSGPSFTVLSLGTAPCPITVELKGASTTPDFVLCNCSFWCDFDWNLAATAIDNTTSTGSTGAAVKADAFEPGAYEGRYIQASTYTTSWSSIVTNPAEGTIIAIIRPQFANTIASDVTIVDWYDADNSDNVELWYEESDDKWRFSRTRAGVGVTVGSGAAAAQSFASDTHMALAASWGGDGMKIYRDGTKLDSNDTTTGPAESSGTLKLGDNGDTQRPDCKYERLYIFPYQMTDEQVARYSANPESVICANVKKSCSANIGANDRVVLDFDKQTATAVATADLAHTNHLAYWDANGWPLLIPPEMCFYVPSTETIGGIKVSYRKRYL